MLCDADGVPGVDITGSDGDNGMAVVLLPTPGPCSKDAGGIIFSSLKKTPSDGFVKRTSDAVAERPLVHVCNADIGKYIHFSST